MLGRVPSLPAGPPSRSVSVAASAKMSEAVVSAESRIRMRST